MKDSIEVIPLRPKKDKYSYKVDPLEGLRTSTLHAYGHLEIDSVVIINDIKKAIISDVIATCDINGATFHKDTRNSNKDLHAVMFPGKKAPELLTYEEIKKRLEHNFGDMQIKNNFVLLY